MVTLNICRISVEASIQLQSFLDNGHKNVYRNGDPNLGLQCVLAGAVKCFDPQVLFDPFEEQLHLPAAFVKLRDHDCRQREVVKEKRNASLFLHRSNGFS